HRPLLEKTVTACAREVLLQERAQHHVLQRTVRPASSWIEPLGDDPLSVVGLPDNVLSFGLVGAETAARVTLDLQQAAHEGTPLRIEVEQREVGALEPDIGVPGR